MGNIISIILILASAGLFGFYINPLYAGITDDASGERKDFSERSVQELRLDAVQYSEALDRTRQIELIHQDLLNKSNAIPTADKNRLAKLLPDNIDTVRLIIDINGIAANYGMALKNINVNAGGDLPKAPGGLQAAAPATVVTQTSTFGPSNLRYDSLNLSFSVSGNYSNFFAFVRDLERSLRLVDILSLSFTPSNLSDINKYDLTIRTYKLK